MSTYTFRNPRPLGLVICTLAVVFGMTVLVSIGIHAHVHWLLLMQPSESLPDIHRTMTPSAWFELETMLTHENTWLNLDVELSRARTLLLLANLVLFLIWLRQTVANLWAIGKSTDYTPGWTVGLFLIPLPTLLVAPYQAVRDLWEESHNHMQPEDHERTQNGDVWDYSWRIVLSNISREPALPWWLLIILAFVVFQIVQFFALSEHPGVTTALHRNAFILANLALLFIAQLLFVHIVWRISSLHAGYQRAAQRPDAR